MHEDRLFKFNKVNINNYKEYAIKSILPSSSFQLVCTFPAYTRDACVIENQQWQTSERYPAKYTPFQTMPFGSAVKL